MQQIVDMTSETLEEKMAFQQELADDEAFSFEIEELDGDRAMMLIVPLDPPSCGGCH